MGNIKKAVEWAVNIAKDDTHGYDQTHRNGPDYDCSSLVGTALANAGYPVSKYSTTRNLYSQLVNAGFKKCSKPWKAGDIHLAVGHHVVMSIDANNIVHASQNEFGGATGGKTGDQTGKEICTRSYYEPSYGWTYHLRAPENTTASKGVLNKVATSTPALEFHANIAGTYTTKDNLNIRRSNSTQSGIMYTLLKGDTVRCYGYHTGKWYLIVAVAGNTEFTGFVYSEWLKK